MLDNSSIRSIRSNYLLALLGLIIYFIQFNNTIFICKRLGVYIKSESSIGELTLYKSTMLINLQASRY